MSERDWWVRPSECLWELSDPAEATRWSAWLDGDGGQQWMLTLRTEGRGLPLQEKRVRWNPRRKEFAFSGLPAWLPPTAERALRDTLSHRSMGIGGLSAGEQELLDVVAASLDAPAWVDGADLRQQLGLRKVRFRFLVRLLHPRHLRVHEDTYTLTLPGLLASARAREATHLVEDVLRLFRSRVKAGEDLHSYTWEELKEEAGLPDTSLAFAGHVLRAAGLERSSDVPGGTSRAPTRWSFPRDVDVLSRCRNLDTFLAYIRESDTGRPWPTVPVLLPEELEPSGPTVAEEGEAPPSPAPRPTRVLISHGGSPVWRQLQGFLGDRLGLEHEVLNREPGTDRATARRLEELLGQAGFAFIVMTAEDERSTDAWQNVVHEAGLFQGRLGFQRAAILLEVGCEGFPDLLGLTVIRFPKGDLMACKDEVKRMLVRERLLSGR
jgi:hypothetical protein